MLGPRLGTEKKMFFLQVIITSSSILPVFPLDTHLRFLHLDSRMLKIPCLSKRLANKLKFCQARLQSQYLSICSCNNLYLLIPMCFANLIHEHREHCKHHVCSLDHWLAKLWTGPRKSRCEGNSKGRLTCTNDIWFPDFPQSSSTVAHGIIVEWDERNDSNLDLSVDVFVLPGCVLVDKRTRETMELHNVTTSNVQHCATRCSTTLSLGPEQILQWSPRERKIKNRQKNQGGFCMDYMGFYIRCCVRVPISRSTYCDVEMSTKSVNLEISCHRHPCLGSQRCTKAQSDQQVSIWTFRNRFVEFNGFVPQKNDECIQHCFFCRWFSSTWRHL